MEQRRVEESHSHDIKNVQRSGQRELVENACQQATGDDDGTAEEGLSPRGGAHHKSEHVFHGFFAARLGGHRQISGAKSRHEQDAGHAEHDACPHIEIARGDPHEKKTGQNTAP